MNQATFIADCSFGSKMLYKTPAMHRDIFRDTLIAKKVWRRRGSNPQPTGWETRKNFKHQPGFETTTYWLGNQ